MATGVPELGSLCPSSQSCAKHLRPHPAHRDTCPALAGAHAPTPTATPTGTQPSCPSRLPAMTPHKCPGTRPQPRPPSRRVQTDTRTLQSLRRPVSLESSLPGQGGPQTCRHTRHPCLPSWLGPRALRRASRVQSNFPDALPSCCLTLGILPLRLGNPFCDGTGCAPSPKLPRLATGRPSNDLFSCKPEAIPTLRAAEPGREPWRSEGRPWASKRPLCGVVYASGSYGEPLPAPPFVLRVPLPLGGTSQERCWHIPRSCMGQQSEGPWQGGLGAGAGLW